MAYFLHHLLWLFYGTFALLALAAVWRNREARPLGWALVVAWALSNAIAFGLDFDWRPVLYPMIDLMIAVVARDVWRRNGYRIAGVITGLSLLNCVVNVAFALVVMKHATELEQSTRSIHTLSTNLIFWSKCIVLTIWGVADANAWSGRFGLVRLRHREDLRAGHVEAGEE